MKLHVSNDIEELSRDAAGWISTYIQEVLSKRNRFTICLSGGSTPKKLYHMLAADPNKSRINWGQMHFFWGDERFVPFTDEKNNAKMAFDSLLSLVPARKEQIHIIQTDSDADLSAMNYEQLLHRYFDKQLYTFDLVLLGLGNDAHTLSLFPGYEGVIFEKEYWAKSVYVVEQDNYRITLTSPVVNAAARVAFLVSGSDKAEALQHVVAGKYDPPKFPAQIIRPLNGELYWFVDKAASSGLQYAV